MTQGLVDITVAPRQSRRKRLLSLTRYWLLPILAVAAIYAFSLGLRLRHWTYYKATANVHFTGDDTNAWTWGSFVDMRPPLSWQPWIPTAPGKPHMTWSTFFHRWSHAYVRRKNGEQGYYDLDYVPGKLLVMSLWIWHERLLHPNASNWSPSMEGPILAFNTTLEVITCLGLILLVRHWRNRRLQPPAPRRIPGWERFTRWRWRDRASAAGVNGGARPPPAGPAYTPAGPAPPLVIAPDHAPTSNTTWLLAFLAAMLFWFNPSILLSAHGWVQEDMWLVPFYVFAIYFGSLDWMFAAGVIIAVGGFFKGQTLFAAAVFILWPLFELRPMAGVRWIAGFLLGFGLLLSPWLFRVPASVWFFVSVLLAAAIVVPCALFFRRRPKWTALLALGAAPLILWPCLAGAPKLFDLCAIAFAAILCALPWLLSRRRSTAMTKRRMATLAAKIIGFSAAAAIGLIALFFHPSFAWWKGSYYYGTHHYNIMSFDDTCNLANILARDYGWKLHEVVFHLHVPFRAAAIAVQMKYFLFSLFVLSLVLCAWGAARQHRRNDPRFIVAMITPLVMFFALVAQMHERYLIWGAALLAAGTAVDAGITLIGVFFSIITTTMTLAVMLRVNQFAMDPTWLKIWNDIQASEPGAGYAVLAFAAVCMYESLTTRKRIGLPPLVIGSADSVAAFIREDSAP